MAFVGGGPGHCLPVRARGRHGHRQISGAQMLYVLTNDIMAAETETNLRDFSFRRGEAAVKPALVGDWHY